jgi:spermidine/putrescine transport system substrate-binding protein
MKAYNMKTSNCLSVILVLLFGLLGTSCERKPANTNGKPAQQRTLNLLCWSGYEEPQFIGVFEKKFNVKVNYKTFFGGDGMLALVNQSPKEYDVVVVDKDYLSKLYAAGRLKELTPSDYDFSDYFQPFKNTYGWVDGKLYGVPVEFGTAALVYNTSKLTAEDVKSYKILLDPKVKGRVSIWDWYLPNMGNISQSLGNSRPLDLNAEQFAALQKRLAELRPQVAAFHAAPTEYLSALASEQTWIMPGAGEPVASILRQQGKPIDWTVPDEGGLIWVDTLVLLNDAPNAETAKLYIQWMMTPEAQALLSQKQAFHSNVPNRKAYDRLTPAQRSILKIHNEADAITLVSKLKDRALPVNPPEKAWQDAWEEFKTKK